MMMRIGWPALWLVFGMLAAHEIGMRGTASSTDPVLAVCYAAAASLGLWMMTRRSVRAGRPARLLIPFAISLAGPALIALLIRQTKPPPVWTDTLFVASGFLAFSACVILIATVVAWRRREAGRERRHKDMQASARRRLGELPSSGPMQQFAAELEYPPQVEDADLLPARMLER
jgi:hypothetical protein